MSAHEDLKRVVAQLGDVHNKLVAREADHFEEIISNRLELEKRLALLERSPWQKLKDRLGGWFGKQKPNDN